MARDARPIVGICIRRASDRALLGRFLEESGFGVALWDESKPAVGRAGEPVLVIVDEASARSSGEAVHAAKRAALPLHVPVLLLLPSAAPAGSWMRRGYDDIIREPIGKNELLARIEAFVKLHRQSETAREHSEARFRVTFDEAPIGIAHVTTDGEFSRVNRRFREILALEAPDLPSLKFAWLWPDAPGSESLLELARDARQAREWQFRRPSGESVWLRLTISYAREGVASEDYFVAILEDITESRLVAASLADARDRLRTILDSSPLAIWTLDPRGRVTSMNPAAEALFGWSAREILGRVPPDAPPAEIPGRAALIARAFAGERVRDDHAKRCRRDGALMHLEISAAPIRVEDAAVREVVVTATDITARVGALEGLEAAKQELELRVEKRTRELKRAAAELEAFSYSVSHDLRAPVRAVSGFARMLKEQHADTLGPPAAALVDRLIAAGERMGAMIDGLLLISSASRVEIVEAAIDLSAVARSVVEDLVASESGHMPIVSIEPGMVARGDEWMIRQLLENLIGNAWKYSSRRRRPRIRFASRTGRDGRREFFVRDNGAGFDMAYASKLFKPFSRLHSVSEFPGSGIGLATVQRIIERLGGEIRAQSRPNRGATFSFRLRDE